MKTLESLAQTVENVKVEVVKDAVLDVIEKGVRKFIRIMLEIYPFGPIEDVNIPRGRKGGFVPKVIDRFKASRLNKTIKKEITAWLNRPINKKFSYLFIDGIFLKIRRKIISKEAILCAVGITESGEKQHCLFHKMSNLRAKCPRSEWPLIKAKIHKIYFALNERDARENARAFIKKYKDIFPRLVDCIKKDLDSCIAYMKHLFRRWKHTCLPTGR